MVLHGNSITASLRLPAKSRLCLHRRKMWSLWSLRNELCTWNHSWNHELGSVLSTRRRMFFKGGWQMPFQLVDSHSQGYSGIWRTNHQVSSFSLLTPCHNGKKKSEIVKYWNRSLVFSPLDSFPSKQYDTRQEVEKQDKQQRIPLPNRSLKVSCVKTVFQPWMKKHRGKLSWHAILSPFE